MENFEPMKNLMSEQDKLGMVWVDTVGWDDAELRDDNTFREILSYIGKLTKYLREYEYL